LKWGNTHRPANAGIVVVLFHSSLGKPGDADAVAAHQQRFLLALTVGEPSIQGF
jgi:hypothetical protein